MCGSLRSSTTTDQAINCDFVIDGTVNREGNANLSLRTTLGQEVRTLANEVPGASCQRVRWDGRDGRGKAVSSGMYFPRVAGETAGGGKLSVETRKMMLMK